VCCFDKTGTITKPGMDYLGVKEMTKLGFIDANVHPRSGSHMEAAMACCHSLSKFKKPVGTNPMNRPSEPEYMLVGATVDKLMFESTGWKLEHSDRGNVVSNSTRSIKVLRSFDFDHHRMTSSVIAQVRETASNDRDRVVHLTVK
jgi:cation-transporting ATPase 13A3/4/5